MRPQRVLLLSASLLVVLFLAGGSVALRVGAADGAYRDVVLFSELLSIIGEQYVNPVDADALVEGACRGMLASLDANGAYLTAEEVAEWKRGEPAGGADPGIAVLKMQGSFEVVLVAKGSSAEEAGVVVGDQIRRIEGRTSRTLSQPQARRMLRGQPGTTVTLEVLRSRQGFVRETLRLERRARSGASQEIEAEEDTAVLTVRDLSGVVPGEVAREIESARTDGAKRLLIDLRNVAESGPREAVAFLELFAAGPLLTLKDRSGKVLETLEAREGRTAWRGPLGILVNRGTAGGAEAVARVLQARGIARVYGESTYGLGSEPKLFELDGGSGLLFSTWVWQTPSGESWNQHGVEPDREIALDGPPETSASEQRRRAIQALVADTSEDQTERKAA